MKERCYNSHNIMYANYGERGITVCDEWKQSFLTFKADMGPKPSATYSIDRIDPNGNYEPSNCRWATRHQQAMNKRNNLKVPGVYLVKQKTGIAWHARLRMGGVSIFQKNFRNYDEAVAARKAAELKYL